MHGPQNTAPLTNPDLTPYEAAARLYCAQTGQDPDAEMVIPHPFLRGTTQRVPFWHAIAERMVDLSLLLTSMRKASEGQTTPAVIIPRGRT